MPWRIFTPSADEGPLIAAAWPNRIRSAATPISSARAGTASSNRQHKALSCIFFIEVLLRDGFRQLGEKLAKGDEELANPLRQVLAWPANSAVESLPRRGFRSVPDAAAGTRKDR